MRYLSPEGHWVGDREDARDFYSLLPAYYFARDHTSRHFQVVLYCREDNFCASIIAGVGVAHHHGTVMTVAPKKISLKRFSRCNRRNVRSVKGVYLPSGFNDIKKNLN